MARPLNAEEQGQTSEHTDEMATVLVEKQAGSRQLPSRADAFADLYERGGVVEPPLPVDALRHLYDENPIHAACIRAKVTDAVGRGWLLEREGGATDDEGDNEERLAAELRRWLRDKTTGAGGKLGFGKLVAQTVREMEKIGYGCVEVARDGDLIGGLFTLPAHTVRATRDPDVFVQIRNERKVYFKRFGAEGNVSASHGHKDYGDDPADVEEGDEANEILVMEHYDERSSYYGVPPWVSNIPTSAELKKIREYNVDWFDTGGMTDVLIHVTAQDGAKTIADSILKAFKEAKQKFARRIVSHGGDGSKVDTHQLSPAQDKRDGQFTDRREDLVKEILISHEMPPYRVGWAELGSLGGSAAKEMIGAYRDGVIEPLQEIVEETLAGTIFADDGGFSLRGFIFRFVDKDWQQEELDVEKATRGVEFGLLTPAQGARLMGEEPPPEEEAPHLYRHYFKGQALGEGFSEAMDVVRQVEKALDRIVKDAEPDDDLEVAA